jgi:hypothetical protein
MDDDALALNPNHQTIFYIFYMYCYFLANDFNGAKYLWKRISANPGEDVCHFKSLRDFWSIGKYLYNKEFTGAIKYCKENPWEDLLHPIVKVSFSLSPCPFFNHFSSSTERFRPYH